MLQHVSEKITVKPAREDQGKIAQFVSKLSSYLMHEKDFFESRNLDKVEFFAEYVLMLEEENFPNEAWSNDAIRFLRKRLEFFPQISKLIELLNDFVAPIKAKYFKEKARENLGIYDDNGFTLGDRIAYKNFMNGVRDNWKTSSENNDLAPKFLEFQQYRYLQSQHYHVFEKIKNEGFIREDIVRKYTRCGEL